MAGKAIIESGEIDEVCHLPELWGVDEMSESEEDDDGYGNPVTETRGRPLGWRKHKYEEDDRSRSLKKIRPLIQVQLLNTFMCCSLMCLLDIPVAVMSSMRKAFIELTQIDKTHYVRHWLRDHTSNDITRFIVGSKDVCLMAWSTVIGLPASTFYSIKKKFEAGNPIRNAGRQDGALTSNGVFAMVWLETFASKNGDKMPDRIGINLPCCLTKTSIYTYYKNDVNDGAVSSTQFFRIWRQHLSHVKIPKATRFSICDTCVKIAKKLEVCQCKSERNLLYQYREIHLRQQNLERVKYYKHISKAKDAPNKYISIIIDGMDQDKTSVPHLTTTPKSLANLFLLRINLMGAIVHGIGMYGFFDPFRWGHGSSYTVSVLVHVLSMQSSLPPTLYLQLDNCPGSNKNRYLLGFLAALVEADVFRKVKVSFLMVGHTHEDIDQLFSRFSVWLRHNDALTVEQLLSGFEKCYTPNPTALMTDRVFDIQKWLQINNIRNHSKPHVFKIKQENGATTVSFKKWSTDKEWHTVNGSLLKDSMDVYGKIPEINPDSSRIDGKVQQDIGILTRFLKRPNIDNDWQQFFNSLREDELVERNAQSVVLDLKERRQADREDVEVNPQVLEGLDNIDEQIPEVIIGRKTSARQPHSSIGMDVAESVDKGNVVAVYTEDFDYGYYLLKVTKPTRSLAKETSDQWGNNYPVGSKVIEGFYYDRSTNTDQYKLLSKQRAIVFSRAVVYKLDDSGSDTLLVSVADHKNIQSAIDRSLAEAVI